MTKIRKNSVIINEDRVVKKRNDKVLELYNYLDEVGYDNYPRVIDSDEDSISSEYINSKKNHELIKGTDFIKAVANLHNKTLTYKDVSKNKYKKIYDMLLSNIEYLKKFYENKIKIIEEEIYMSPSNYLLIRNYSIINESLNYSKNTLKKWFKLVQNKSKERVCVVHNNLSLDHYIKGDKDYLLSFDNYLVDTPVLDLYKFYIKEGINLDFISLIKEYNNSFTMLEEEKLLFNILISMPPKIENIKDEYLNSINIKDTFSYIYSTMIVVNENK